MVFGEKRNLTVFYSLLTLLAPICVSASGPVVVPAGLATQVVQVGSEQVRFHVIQGRYPAMLSEQCRAPDGKLDCGAHRALRAASFRQLNRAQAASGNPAASLCTSAGGTVVSGQDSVHNTGDFCRFPDRSMVDLAALKASADSNARLP